MNLQGSGGMEVIRGERRRGGNDAGSALIYDIIKKLR